MNAESNEHNILKGYNMLLYFAGTMIMYDPAQECITDFWTQGILKQLPVTSQNPRFMKAAAQLNQSVGDQNSNIEMMKKDFDGLFMLTADAMAPPYESLYREKNKLSLTKPSSVVKEFYDSYGWQSRLKGKVPDDHLGVELLFLTLMIEKYLEMDDETCNIEMRKEICRFISLHLMSWIPDWNAHIQEHANTLSYKGIGTLVQACIEDLYSMMGQTSLKFN